MKRQNCQLGPDGERKCSDWLLRSGNRCKGREPKNKKVKSFEPDTLVFIGSSILLISCLWLSVSAICSFLNRTYSQLEAILTTVACSSFPLLDNIYRLLLVVLVGRCKTYELDGRGRVQVQLSGQDTGDVRRLYNQAFLASGTLMSVWCVRAPKLFCYT